MSGLPVLNHHVPIISSLLNTTDPATTDPSLPPTTITTANTVLHPRKFDLLNDTELYIHENHVIPRLFFYEPFEQITRLKHIQNGSFVGNPRTLVLSIAGATSPLKRDPPQASNINFNFSSSSSSSSKPNNEEIHRAAYSLHFGPKSRYNSTGKIKETGSKVEMQKIAELAAACEALEFVEMECKMRVEGFKQVSGEPGEGGLVVGVTSSTNLWYGITEHIVS